MSHQRVVFMLCHPGIQRAISLIVHTTTVVQRKIDSIMLDQSIILPNLERINEASGSGAGPPPLKVDRLEQRLPSTRTEQVIIFSHLAKRRATHNQEQKANKYVHPVG